MEDESASYIRMMLQVHHLIEECIVFKMSMEECMEALSKHANIKPIITSTVWKELEKENKEFFEAYSKSREDQMVKVSKEASEMETREGIQRVLSVSDAASKTDHTPY
ncbi:uncharacterized protein LOC122275191 isoform X2 [Carya illinoinensis]|uniref:uncharacterized protein LOC122275191 isoform X2 n=1 Tax=Carya illinoinensis TaxID=32201 RepID=UPI001C719F77|nr:uncharacterized protein LOC122275191 isoform X2 [Carya illinoinensis]